MLAAALLLRDDPLAAARLAGKGGSRSSPSDDTARVVPWANALTFLLGACVLGTNGEGLLDSAVGLAVRGSLARGNTQLAIANQTAVLVSMVSVSCDCASETLSLSACIARTACTGPRPRLGDRSHARLGGSAWICLHSAVVAGAARPHCGAITRLADGGYSWRNRGWPVCFR